MEISYHAKASDFNRTCLQVRDIDAFISKMIKISFYDRVLYLAMSPDGKTIVTGAGDETIRFWNVFPGQTVSSPGRLGLGNMGNSGGCLFPLSGDIR